MTLILFSVLFFGLAVYLSRTPILRNIGRFLIVQDQLKKADVIIVLGGDMDRIDEAVRLYKKGFAKKIIVTGKNAGPGMKRRAVRAGVPSENVIIEPEAASTYQHPIYVKTIMQEEGFRLAIVVSSSYHMRRSKMLFDRAFKNTGVALIYYPVQDSWFDVDSWWTKASSRRAVKSEYGKLVVNVWGNGFTELVAKLTGREREVFNVMRP